MVLHASKKQRGAAAVELAILLPIVLLIIGGIVDFGRFFFYGIQLTNAAREGARAASITGTPTTVVQTRVSSALSVLNGQASLSTPIPSCPSGATTYATAVVSMNFDWLILKPAMNMVRAGAILPSNIAATGVMKCG